MNLSKNPSNIISLLKISEEMVKNDPIRIAGYAMGKMSTTYFVWNKKFHKELKASNMDKAKKEMLKVVQEDCKSKNLPIPTKFD